MAFGGFFRRDRSKTPPEVHIQALQAARVQSVVQTGVTSCRERRFPHFASRMKRAYKSYLCQRNRCQIPLNISKLLFSTHVQYVVFGRVKSHRMERFWQTFLARPNVIKYSASKMNEIYFWISIVSENFGSPDWTYNVCISLEKVCTDVFRERK